MDDYGEYIFLLKTLNEKLWDVEDAIRRQEKLKEFGEEFIKLARQVYKWNDIRFQIKNWVNYKFDSSLREQKSYDS